MAIVDGSIVVARQTPDIVHTKHGGTGRTSTVNGATPLVVPYQPANVITRSGDYAATEVAIADGAVVITHQTPDIGTAVHIATGAHACAGMAVGNHTKIGAHQTTHIARTVDCTSIVVAVVYRAIVVVKTNQSAYVVETSHFAGCVAA